jgi:hypothetical protein
MLEGAHEVLRVRTPEYSLIRYTPPEVEWMSANHASVVGALGADAVERLATIGRALPFEQVIDLTLGRTVRVR